MFHETQKLACDASAGRSRRATQAEPGCLRQSRAWSRPRLASRHHHVIITSGALSISLRDGPEAHCLVEGTGHQRLPVAAHRNVADLPSTHPSRRQPPRR
eukprot:407120-Rhodomonas_salina.1